MMKRASSHEKCSSCKPQQTKSSRFGAREFSIRAGESDISSALRHPLPEFNLMDLPLNAPVQAKPIPGPVCMECEKEEEDRDAEQPAVLQRQADPDLEDDEDEVLQGKFESHMPSAVPEQSRPKPNRTGMPDRLKAGIESLSGFDISDVRVHANSDLPAGLNALAYTQGNQIYLGPGQGRHLPHEAWHVVQQKQGRVRATRQMSGAAINDDAALEREADVIGAKTLQMTDSNQLVTPSTLLQLRKRSASPFPIQDTKGGTTSDLTGMPTKTKTSRPRVHTLLQQRGIVQRTRDEDVVRVQKARDIMLSTRTPLDNDFKKYKDMIDRYKPLKKDSRYREDSSMGLLHWAEHLNIAGTGALAEIRRVLHEGSLKWEASERPGWKRRSRLGKDTKKEPDVISHWREDLTKKKEKWAEEIKGVTSDNYQAVNENIKKALKQLDKDRALNMDDRRVVIYINNVENSWPWTSKDNARNGKTTLLEEVGNRLTGFKHEKDAKYKLRVNGITNYDSSGNMDGKPGSWSIFGDLTTFKAKKKRQLEEHVVSKKQETKKQKPMTIEEPDTPEQNLQ